MALPIPPNNPNTPIPNNPFYSPETTFFCGAYYPALVTPTSGLTVNPNGTITVTGGGGGGGITALAAGPGIALSSTTGNITVCTDLIAGPNIALSQSGNQIQISATGVGTGTVTAISAGNGLCSTTNPITTSGSLTLNTNCVIPPNAFNIKGNLLVGTGAGTYTALNPGTDGQVLIACAGSGAAGLCWGAVGSVTQVTADLPLSVTTGTTTPHITIAAASTTAAGAVQLNNTVASTSTTQALTAAQGKVLQDQITTLLTSPGIELAGTIDASTGLVSSVTSVGTSRGYTTAAVLPAASSITNNSYVIVTTPGTFTPPGGTSTVATKGDWFLASQTSPGVFEWEFLNVGFDAPAATTTTAGIVELATNVETATGTDATIAVTPAGLASAYIPKAALTAKGTLISASAPGVPSALAVGLDNCVLVACNAAPTGLCWTSPPVTGIPCGCITAKGTLISGTAASTPTALPVGNDNYVLTACNAASTGLCWAPVPPSGIPCSCVVGKGAIITGTAGSAPAGLPVGLDNQVLVACSGCACGLTWATPAVTPSPATPTLAGVVLGRTDTSNAALGCNALLPGVGSNNVAIGLAALRSNQTNDNIAIGFAALCSNTTGFQNTAVGHIAMCSLVCLTANPTASANQNVAVGSTALCKMTSGLSNDAVGALAMQNFTSGCYNVSLGGYSSFAYASGNFSTAVGHRALNCATGCCNTSLGAFAGENITTGCGNVAIGPFTQIANPAGNNQLTIGYGVGANWLTGSSTLAIKPGAGIIDCTNTCGVLGQVLMSTGANSVCWGYGNPYPAWTSAGTIQSVGWTSTGGVNVVPGSTSRNNVSYRQVGIKEWQVVYTFTATGGFTNAGSGQYLFVLPNGLQFDTTLPWQPAFTGGASPSHANRQYFLPGPSSMQITFTGGGNGAQFGMGVVVYNATRFRIFATDVGNGAPQPVSNGYWGGSPELSFSVSFQFTSL